MKLKITKKRLLILISFFIILIFKQFINQLLFISSVNIGDTEDKLPEKGVNEYFLVILSQGAAASK
ncbi:MAG: hypothetical protein TRG1_515 [Flavobacteriaceae bacterium FS1-H7996/R]|nr:MAG: hypothetical protein TRG1_515 [Flavobacteriaceae bacterium FS1-H7996/R]